MKRRKQMYWVLIITCTVLMLLPGCASTPDATTVEMGDEAGAYAYLERFVEDQMKKSGTVGVSVVIADRDGVLWSSGFGYADKENKIPVTQHTLFDLASVSKLFTATAVMQLVEDDTVDLDTTVATYLPAFNVASRFADTKEITVRNLLTHHSGIQPDWLKGMLYDVSAQMPNSRFTETADLLDGVEVCWPPEYVWAYSNLGYSLLGSLVDSQGPWSFFDYIRERVLNPVGMSQSTFDLQPATYEMISKGYADGDPVPHFIEREVPGGGMVSSADELGLFISAYLDPDDTRLLDSDSREQMYTRQNSHVSRDLDFAQGLCWMISDHGFENVGRGVFHDGGEWSANTSLTLLPDMGFGLAVLTNSAEGSAITGPITREIIRVLYRLNEGTDPVEYTRPADVHLDADDSLVGTYYYQSLGIVEVYEKKGEMWARSGGLKMKLIPNAGGRYRLQPILLGFLPLSVPFLEPMEISLKAIDNDVLSGVYQYGEALPEVGLRIDRPALAKMWYDRQGTYEIINADEGEFPIIAPWEFAINEGFPTITGKLYGSFPFSLVVIPKDDNLTLWAGLGRRAGDTIRFEEHGEDTYIHYQGFVYRKLSD